MFLLDTPVVLALRQARAGRADPGLVAWAGGIARQRLFISALTLLEIENAAARLARQDKAAGLAAREWLDARLGPAFDGRVLAVDAAVVRRRAQLAYASSRDGLLAATALCHGLTLVTDRVTAFRAGKVKLLNPSGLSSPAPSADDEDWGQPQAPGQQWLKTLYTRG
jgi:toxin FitB